MSRSGKERERKSLKRLGHLLRKEYTKWLKDLDKSIKEK